MPSSSSDITHSSPLTLDVLLKEAAADKFRYVMWGTFDEPEKVPPKGEFFCRYKPQWMPDIPGILWSVPKCDRSG